jgi:hypothetical protein
MLRKKANRRSGVLQCALIVTLATSCTPIETENAGDEAVLTKKTTTTLSSVVNAGLVERLGLSQEQADYITGASTALNLTADETVDSETSDNSAEEMDSATKAQAESSAGSIGSMIEKTAELNKLNDSNELYVTTATLVGAVPVIVDESLTAQLLIQEGLTFAKYTFIMKSTLDDTMLAVAQKFPESALVESLEGLYGAVVESLEDWPKQNAATTIKSWNEGNENVMSIAGLMDKVFEYVSAIESVDTQKMLIAAVLEGVVEAKAGDEFMEKIVISANDFGVEVDQETFTKAGAEPPKKLNEIKECYDLNQPSGQAVTLTPTSYGWGAKEDGTLGCIETEGPVN